MNRYSRQTVLPQVGPEGQKRLEASVAAVVGLGALGCVSSGLLARAGVGELRLIDRDVVELENLQRQLLFAEADIGHPKAAVAADRLRAANSSTKVTPLSKDLHASNVDGMLRGVHIVVDGTDNMETRLLLNDWCLKNNVPFVYGGAIATHGMMMAIAPGHTACFRCLVPELPPPGSLPTCDTAGILNAVSTAVGALQANAALKALLGHPPEGRLMLLDLWSGEVERIQVKRREDCVACGAGRYEFLATTRQRIVTALCGRETISIDPVQEAAVSLPELAAKLAKVGRVREGGGVLFFEAEGASLTIFPDGRALVKGTSDEGRAQSLYAKYIGY